MAPNPCRGAQRSLGDVWVVQLCQGRLSGNQGLQEVIQSSPQLFPQWLVLSWTTETTNPVASIVYTLCRLWRRFPASNLKHFQPTLPHAQNSGGIWVSDTHSLLEAPVA